MKVIGHIDMDAFYTQVEIGRDPGRLAGQPVVVIQYNPFGDLSTLRPEEDRIKPESNGSIIAVSYEARKHGVKRNMMAQQAKKLCPTLQIVQVPVAHGKADLMIYRDAGAAVISVLSKTVKACVCERASIDEAYLDVTAAAQQLLADARQKQRSSSAGSSGVSTAGPAAAGAGAPAAEAAAGAAGVRQAGQEEAEQSGAAGSSSGLALPLLEADESLEGWHVAGVDGEVAGAVQAWWQRPVLEWNANDALLAAGALIIARARAAVKATLGYSCSAGIAHSKILAKLGSGLHKPAQQTVVPAAAVAGLLAPLPVSKLRQLGGKFGEEVMAKLSVSTVGELAAVPLPRLEAVLGVQDALWLQRLAQGKDAEEVKPRTLPKSISCGKTFRGVNVLTSLTAVHTWLVQLGHELQERIEADRQQHQRLPKLLTVSFDSAPLDAGGAEAGPAQNPTAAAAAAAGAGADSRENGSSSGPSHGRLTAQNWRAGATNISRSTTLRHARSDAIASDALGLVKKWARDRPNGFRIVTMFISASNFSIAPTGASTLDRFFSAPAAPAAAATATTAASHPAAAAAAAAAATAASHPAAAAGDNISQRRLVPPPPLQQQPAASAGQAGVKHEAAGAAGFGRVSKAARLHTQPGDLKQLLAAAAPSAAATPAAATAAATSGPVQTAAAAAATQQEGRSAAERAAAAGSASTGDLGWAFASGADSDMGSAGEAGGLDTGRSEGEGEDEGSIVISDSQGLLGDAGADSNAHTDMCSNSFGAGSTAQTAVAAAAAARPGAFSACTAVPGHLKLASPARPALSALQALQPFSASAAAGGVTLPGSAAADCQAAGQESGGAPDSTQPSQVLPPSLHAWLGGTQPQQAGSQQGEGECAAQHMGADGRQDAAAPAAAGRDPGSSFAQQQEEQPGSREQRQGEPAAWPPAQPHAGGGGLLPGQPLQLADLDPEVMAALPWDIQIEVQQQLRAGTRRGAGSTQASRRGARVSGGRRGQRQQQQQQQQGTIHRFLKK